jgi:hypothetical protein
MPTREAKVMTVNCSPGVGAKPAGSRTSSVPPSVAVPVIASLSNRLVGASPIWTTTLEFPVQGEVAVDGQGAEARVAAGSVPGETTP